MRAKIHALLQYIFRVQRLLDHTDSFSFWSLLLTFIEISWWNKDSKVSELQTSFALVL